MCIKALTLVQLNSARRTALSVLCSYECLCSLLQPCVLLLDTTVFQLSNADLTTACSIQERVMGAGGYTYVCTYTWTEIYIIICQSLSVCLCVCSFFWPPSHGPISYLTTYLDSLWHSGPNKSITEVIRAQTKKFLHSYGYGSIAISVCPNGYIPLPNVCLSVRIIP